MRYVTLSLWDGHVNFFRSDRRLEVPIERLIVHRVTILETSMNVSL